MLEEFRSAFGLKRANEELGLSVVIPYPEKGLSRTDLARAAIKQFFLPILSGQLIVEIRAESETVLSATTLLQAIDQFIWEEGEAEVLRRRVRLAKWAIDEGRPRSVVLARPGSLTQPKFEPSMFDAAVKAELSRRFLSGERIAIRVPTPVEQKGADPVWSHVEVFLEYDRLGTTREDLYVRKGLTLVEHSGQARQAGLRSILIAEDRPIYEMLRSSENVAHTKWRQRGADRLNQQYVRGPAKIGYVLGIVPGIVQALLSPEDEADWWTLADLFPEPQASPLQDRPVTATEGAAAGSPDENTPTEDDGVDPPPPPSPPPAGIRQWKAKPTRDGLRIESNPEYHGDLRRMKLTVAYGLLNRRKLKAHDPEDFSFQTSNDMVESQGADVEVRDHNVLAITPTIREFSVTLKEFDRRRALDYQVAVEDA